MYPGGGRTVIDVEKYQRLNQAERTAELVFNLRKNVLDLAVNTRYTYNESIIFVLDKARASLLSLKAEELKYTNLLINAELEKDELIKEYELKQKNFLDEVRMIEHFVVCGLVFRQMKKVHVLHPPLVLPPGYVDVNYHLGAIREAKLAADTASANAQSAISVWRTLVCTIDRIKSEISQLDAAVDVAGKYHLSNFCVFDDPVSVSRPPLEEAKAAFDIARAALMEASREAKAFSDEESIRTFASLDDARKNLRNLFLPDAV